MASSKSDVATIATDVVGADAARLANAIRALAMDAVEAAKSGHPGMPMGMADVATVLFTRFLKYDAAAPDWPDRDRFVLSAGHGSMLLYALLYLTGYADMTLEDIRTFRQLDSRAAGHPEYGHAKGIETTTGPLGQGFANAVGMAIAERHFAARFGPELVDHRTYVIASDGDLMEGVSHEAASLAGHLRLDRLIVLFDDNGISIDGRTALACSDDQLMRFAAYGWRTEQVDGHDREAVAEALTRAQTADRPSLIACRTTIGYGAPSKADTAGAHGAPLGADEVAGARKALDWPYAPFEIPNDVMSAWRAAGAGGRKARTDWEARHAKSPSAAEFTRSVSGALPEGWRAALAAHRRKLLDDKPSAATRQSSGGVLEVLTPAIPELLGGSADLTGSVNTKTKEATVMSADDYGAGYIHYGVREHGMAAAMNGMALHGGVVPYGGTFLIFSDYLRPTLRLAAMMKQRVIHVLTHDSIGLGEDGPTHQPVEQLSALRAIPGLRVFRPADAVETAECWEAALLHDDGPSAIVLTRQGVPALRTAPGEDNLAARGGYVLAAADGAPQIVIIATGSEVQLALAAREALAEDGIAASVVSMPCCELFDAQDAAWRETVLPAGVPRVAVEAGGRQSWDRYLCARGAFVGMAGYGASAPAAALFEHFGITADNVAAAARRVLGS